MTLRILKHATLPVAILVAGLHFNTPALQIAYLMVVILGCTLTTEL